MSAEYPPPCHGGCGGHMQPMAANGPGSFVVMVCPTCDGDTLDAMWDYATHPRDTPTDDAQGGRADG